MTIESLSDQLNEEMRLKPAEIAECARRLRQLRDAKYITDDGEVLSAFDYAKETEYLKNTLKEHIERTGEPLRVEGLPALMVKPRNRTWYRLPLMLREDAEMLDFLMEQGLVDVSAKARTMAETSPQLAGLKKYAVQGEGARALEWERER